MIKLRLKSLTSRSVNLNDQKIWIFNIEADSLNGTRYFKYTSSTSKFDPKITLSYIGYDLEN